MAAAFDPNEKAALGSKELVAAAEEARQVGFLKRQAGLEVAVRPPKRQRRAAAKYISMLDNQAWG